MLNNNFQYTPPPQHPRTGLFSSVYSTINPILTVCFNQKASSILTGMTDVCLFHLNL